MPSTTSTGVYGAWLERTHSFEALTAVVGEGYTLQDGAIATRLNGRTVTSEFFQGLTLSIGLQALRV